MAFRRNNHIKRVNYVIAVYKQYKEQDVPDTFILNNIFPKHNIFISYRTWMDYKSMKPVKSRVPENQINLFAISAATQQRSI